MSYNMTAYPSPPKLQSINPERWGML